MSGGSPTSRSRTGLRDACRHGYPPAAMLRPWDVPIVRNGRSPLLVGTVGDPHRGVNDFDLTIATASVGSRSLAATEKGAPLRARPCRPEIPEVLEAVLQLHPIGAGRGQLIGRGDALDHRLPGRQAADDAGG